ncbi:MAG: phosphate ABC transporter ATP-binding protein [Ignavibacteriaceae bacterium]|nr:phosphate ABC transporter ATP-binding protein [Ignavibacteriaceae bacterium]
MKEIKIQINDFNLWYGGRHILKDINLQVKANRITAVIGPSGCGKTSLLRSVNRLNELIRGARHSGEILIGADEIHEPGTDVYLLRKKVAMVFQKPNLFPDTIFENLAFPLKISGVKDKELISEKITAAAVKSEIWNEVKDRMNEPALNLSVGQQQRLCIARALVSEPEIILMDEPTGSLDPLSTAKIENLIYDMKKDMTVMMVTHNMNQAGRLSDYTVFIAQGSVIEQNSTSRIFTTPQNKKTEGFISGKINLFGEEK